MRSTSLALALTTSLFAHATAQELLQFDGIDQGAPATTPVQNQLGGAGWIGPWLGVNQPAFLLGYYALDNNANDVGFYGAAGTPMGAATFSTDVPSLPWSTHSLELNPTGGVGDYVDLTPIIPGYEGLAVGTISVWMKSTGGGAHAIFAASDSTRPSSEIRLMIEGGVARYDVRGDLNSHELIDGITPVNDGLWHHLAVVVQGNGIAILYVDGNEEGRLQQGFFRNIFHIDTMSIGRNVDSGGAQWHFPGKLDDLAIWGYPLTQSEILDLANAVRPPSAITGTPQIVGPEIQAASLQSPAFASRGLQTYGTAIGTNGGLRAGRQFAPLVDLRNDATYYASCLLRREDSGLPLAGEIHFTDPGAIRGRFGWDDLGNWTCGITAPVSGGIPMLDRTTYFCVFRIDAVASGNDQAFLKVYGPNDTIDATDVNFSGIGGASGWTAIANPAASGARIDTIWITPSAPGGALLVDEIRIGASWDAVTREAYGTGCFGASISQTGRPALGNAGYAITLSGVPANAPVACNFGVSREVGALGALPFDLTPFGAPGCAILTSLEAGAGSVANAQGAASLTLGVPNMPALLGTAMFAQWVALDGTSGNALPIRASDGLEIVFQD